MGRCRSGRAPGPQYIGVAEGRVAPLGTDGKEPEVVGQKEWLRRKPGHADPDIIPA
jgi:hypothetical protein